VLSGGLKERRGREGGLALFERERERERYGVANAGSFEL